MRADTRLGTFADLAAAHPGQAPTLLAVRALVAEVHPDACEAASLREASVWWGWGEAKMRAGYAYARPFAAHTNLGFFQGTALPDPEQRLRGTGRALRHVTLTAPEDVTAPAIRALLVAARDERRDALGIGPTPC